MSRSSSKILQIEEDNLRSTDLRSRSKLIRNKQNIGKEDGLIKARCDQALLLEEITSTLQKYVRSKMTSQDANTFRNIVDLLLKEQKIKNIINYQQNQQKVHELKNMINYLQLERNNIIKSSKYNNVNRNNNHNNTNNSKHNHSNNQISKQTIIDTLIEIHKTICNKLQIKLKNQIDIDQIKKDIIYEYNKKNQVLQEIFNQLTTLSNIGGKNQKTTFKEIIRDIENSLKENIIVKNQNTEIVKEIIQVQKQNSTLVNQYHLLEEEFEYLVEEKLHLQGQIKRNKQIQANRKIHSQRLVQKIQKEVQQTKIVQIEIEQQMKIITEQTINAITSVKLKLNTVPAPKQMYQSTISQVVTPQSVQMIQFALQVPAIGYQLQQTSAQTSLWIEQVTVSTQFQTQTQFQAQIQTKETQTYSVQKQDAQLQTSQIFHQQKQTQTIKQSQKQTQNASFATQIICIDNKLVQTESNISRSSLQVQAVCDIQDKMTQTHKQLILYEEEGVQTNLYEEQLQQINENICFWGTEDESSHQQAIVMNLSGLGSNQSSICSEVTMLKFELDCLRDENATLRRQILQYDNVQNIFHQCI